MQLKTTFVYDIIKHAKEIFMKKLIIDEENCPKSHSCPAVKICPGGALSQEGFNAPVIDYNKCIACGKCSNFCPKKALILQS